MSLRPVEIPTIGKDAYASEREAYCASIVKNLEHTRRQMSDEAIRLEDDLARQLDAQTNLNQNPQNPQPHQASSLLDTFTDDQLLAITKDAPDEELTREDRRQIGKIAQLNPFQNLPENKPAFRKAVRARIANEIQQQKRAKRNAWMKEAVANKIYKKRPLRAVHAFSKYDPETDPRLFHIAADEAAFLEQQIASGLLRAKGKTQEINLLRLAFATHAESGHLDFLYLAIPALGNPPHYEKDDLPERIAFSEQTGRDPRVTVMGVLLNHLSSDGKQFQIYPNRKTVENGDCGRIMKEQKITNPDGEPVIRFNLKTSAPGTYIVYEFSDKKNTKKPNDKPQRISMILEKG
jgi:hypothetical protein